MTTASLLRGTAARTRPAARATGRVGRVLLSALLGPAWRAVRRDPLGVTRRTAPVLVALAIVAGATGQGERHPAPWFGVGPAADAAPAPTPGPSVAEARERADPVVFGLQAELADRGYYGGAIDGIAGSRTRAAIRAWQADQGLQPTGTPDQALLARIRAGASDLPSRARTTPLPRFAAERDGVGEGRTGSGGTGNDGTGDDGTGASADPIATGSLPDGPSGTADGAAAAELSLLVQRGLVAWGADIAVDGVVGPRTREAMADYRGANGLGETATDAAIAAHMRAAGLLP